MAATLTPTTPRTTLVTKIDGVSLSGFRKYRDRLSIGEVAVISREVEKILSIDWAATPTHIGLRPATYIGEPHPRWTLTYGAGQAIWCFIAVRDGQAQVWH